ncbi:MAG: glycoside hydrolase family 3 C-terminal domain-containing protein, partial [Clostridia bacterium]|nr:glycoside hydrolase family 3 C-terminal domain-containing protein [Clostridia bacterium]
MDKKSIIEKMTLEQKAAFLTGKNFWETWDFEEFGIKNMSLSDGPHGVRKQAAAADHLGLNQSIPATCFPTAATMANSWNQKLGEEMGKALGEEARAQRVNMLLGPGTNMKRNPRCGRNFEYFSEDPYLAGKMASSYVKGIQQNGISACVKHFAANNQEERRMSSDSVVDERTLREMYLTAFEIVVKEGKTRSIMSSYNRVNGTYANENEHILKEILRDEWGFDGVVVSDWAGSNDRVAAVKAGSDLEMPACLYGSEDVVKAVNDGTLDIKYVDECVERLLDLFESTFIPEDAPKDFDVVAHNRMARKCAEDSIVLLRNNGVLPLENNVKVALLGDFAENPRYQGAGSSIVNPTVLSRLVDKLITDKVNKQPKNKEYEQGVGSVGKTKIEVVETYLEDMSDYNLDVVGYEKAFDRYGKKKDALIKKAVELTEKADVALLFLGLDEVSEAEGLDREHIRINQNQIDAYKAIKATGKKVVVVLSCGSAVELDWLDDSDALVYACLSGQACADAVMNVITGKVNPSGKLAETFPVRYEDVPTVKYFPGREMTVEYREGPYIGYRYYDTAGVPVQYPFGFGMSYTTFAYGDLTVTDEGVTFTVTNTGTRRGAEISQLYVGKKDGKVFRPKKELKGFAKTMIEAGDSATVTIPFDDKTFRYFNVRTNKWEVEGGEYEIYVGASVEDIRLTGTVAKSGTTDVMPYDMSAVPSYASGKITAVGDEEFKTLLGRDIPRSGYNFYKKKRMVIDENCTVDNLRYSRRWVGRLFSWAIRAVISVCRAFGNRSTANTLVMGVKHQPVRGL